MSERAAQLGGRAVTSLIYAFVAVPSIVVVGSSFTRNDYLTFPPHGFTLRWYGVVLHESDWLSAGKRSLIVAAVVTPIALVLGAPVAYAVVRGRFPGRSALNAALLSPLVLPQVMLGLALLYFLLQLRLLNTILGVAIGHLVVVFPYVVRSVAVSVHNVDTAQERAAAILGAGRLRIIRDVILPALRPGLVAGAIFAAVTSLGELAVTLFVSGPNTTTMPVQIYSHVEYSFDPTVAAVSTLFLLIAVVVLLICDRVIGLTRLF